MSPLFRQCGYRSTSLLYVNRSTRLAVGRHAEEIGKAEVAVSQRRCPALRSTASAVGGEDHVAIGQISGFAIAIEPVVGQLTQSGPVQVDFVKMRRFTAVLPEDSVLEIPPRDQIRRRFGPFLHGTLPQLYLPVAPVRLAHVGEHQPVGVPPQIHVLHVPGPQLAGDQRPHADRPGPGPPGQRYRRPVAALWDDRGSERDNRGDSLRS